jgi:hypothetical protein
MWRTIAAGMARHGWTAIRFRAIGPSGGREQVRGFARPARDPEIGADDSFTAARPLPRR